MTTDRRILLPLSRGSYSADERMTGTSQRANTPVATDPRITFAIHERPGDTAARRHAQGGAALGAMGGAIGGDAGTGAAR
jgi:hypothetical protein